MAPQLLESTTAYLLIRDLHPDIEPGRKLNDEPLSNFGIRFHLYRRINPDSNF